jgi:AmmeMemoRadiSam system protein B
VAKAPRSNKRIHAFHGGGRILPADAGELAAVVKEHLAAASGAVPWPSLGLIVPHCDYSACAATLGQVYAFTEVPRRVVILGTNHSHRGARCALVAHGLLAIPGAVIPVDEPVTSGLGRTLRDAVDDVREHEHEHSIEAQLPFLLARQPALTVTPLLVGDVSLRVCREITDALLSTAVRIAAPDRPLFVATADLCSSEVCQGRRHRPGERRVGERKSDHEHALIDRIVACDSQGVLDLVDAGRVQVCGLAPLLILLELVKALCGAAAVAAVVHRTEGEPPGRVAFRFPVGEPPAA